MFKAKQSFAVATKSGARMVVQGREYEDSDPLVRNREHLFERIGPKKAVAKKRQASKRVK